MILVGEPQAGASPTVDFEHFIEPYFLFLDAGVDVVLASLQGGDPALRTSEGYRTSASPLMTRLRHDQAARDAITDMLEIAAVDASDFDGALCFGVTGRVWPPDDGNLAGTLIGNLLAAGKPVAAVPMQLDLTPRGTAEGIMIAGDRAFAATLAARALIGALQGPSTDADR